MDLELHTEVGILIRMYLGTHSAARMLHLFSIIRMLCNNVENYSNIEVCLVLIIIVGGGSYFWFTKQYQYSEELFTFILKGADFIIGDAVRGMR